MTDLDWMDSALCAQVGSDLFFPEGRGAGSPKKAKRTCRSCDVQAECLEYALTETFTSGDGNQLPLTGIWGATTERERQKIRETRLA